MTPLVSVIVPCFNAGRMLDPALRSVIAQSYPNIEIIFVDNNSSDGSADRAQSIAAGSARPFQLVRCEEQGANNARNLGYELARGDYIQWMDADDALGLQKIALQVDALERDQGAAIACCDWMLSRHLADGKRVDQVTPQRQVDDQILRTISGVWYPPHSYLVRRDAAARLQAERAWLPETKVGTDVEYSAIAALLGLRFRHVPEAKVQYNVWSSTQTSGASTSYAVRVDALRKIWRRLGELALRPDVAPRITPNHRILLDLDWNVWSMPAGSIEIGTRSRQLHELRHVASGSVIEASQREATVATAMLAGGVNKAIIHHALLVATLAPSLSNDYCFIVATLERFRRAGVLTPVDLAAAPDAPTPPRSARLRDATPTPSPSAQATAAVVADAWTQVLRGRGLSENRRFDAAGGDSLRLLNLALNFEERLGIPVPLDALSLRMRPGDFARVLDRILSERTDVEPNRSTPPPDRPEVEAEPPTIFLIRPRHHLDPSDTAMRNACAGLARIVSIGLPAWPELAKPNFSVPVLLDRIVEEIESRAGPGPVRLAGMCLGGMLAHAVARKLEAQGHRIGYVGILDGDATWALAGANPFPLRSLRAMRLRFRDHRLFSGPIPVLARWLANHPRILRWLNGRSWMARLPRKFALRLNWYLNTDMPGRFDPAGLANLMDPANPLDAPVFLFRALEQEPGSPADLHWKELCTQLSIVPVLGNHLTLFEPQHLPLLSRALSQTVRQALAAAAPPTRSEQALAHAAE
jgi:thioesterase domain-containing protein